MSIRLSTRIAAAAALGAALIAGVPAVAAPATAPAATTAAPAAVALRQDRRVSVVNRTGVTMMEFYASSVGQNNWEEDILGSNVLPSGRSVVINIDDGTGYCQYDLKAVFEDGDEVVKYRVNVCEVSNVTFQ